MPCETSAADEATGQYGWVIAVSICTFANFVSNLGVNLQKLALQKRQDRQGPFYTLWIIGFVGILVGSIGDFAALAFGAQSIVAPMASLTLVANVIFAPLIHGERVTRGMLGWTGVIIMGCALSVVFAQHQDCRYSMDELFSFYLTTRFAIYAASVTGSIFASLFGIRWMELRLRRHGPRSAKYQSVAKLHRFSYAAVSGIIGAQSVLFAKSTVELIADSISGGGLLLAYPATYAVIFAMAACVILQIYWLNCGLARWDAVFNVPVFQSFWMTGSVVGGGVFYNEFQSFSWAQSIFFPIGVLVVISGVFQLSRLDVTKRDGETMVIPAGSLGFKDLEEEYEEDEEGDESSLDDDMMEGRDELQFATPAAEPLTKGPVMDGGRDFDLPGEEWKEGWEDMGGSKGLLGEDSSDQWRVAAAQTRIAPETAQTASEEKEGEPPRSPGRAAHARSPAPNSGAAQGAASLRKESMESVESDGSYASDPGTFGSATGLGTAGRGSGGRARGVLGGSPSYPRKAVQGGRAAAAPTLDGGLRHSLLEAGEQGERWRPRTGASLSHRRRRARRRLWHPQEFEAEFGEGPLGLSLRPVLVRVHHLDPNTLPRSTRSEAKARARSRKVGRRAPLRHEEEEEANDDKLRALVSDDDAGGGRWRRREDHPSLAAASGEASASYASGAVSDSGTPSVVRSPRKRGGERAAAAFAHGQVEEAAAVYGPVGSARPMGQPQGEQQGAGTREGAAAGAEELDGVDAAFATEDRGRWKRRATRLVRMWRVSAFSGAGDGTGQAERSGVIHPGDLVTAVNGQTLLDPWLNWEDAIFRINTAHAPFRLRVYRPTAEQGSPAHDSPTGAESGAAGGGEQSPAEGTESAPDVEEGAARPGPVEGAEVAPRPASGSLSGALGTGLGALGRGIAYLPLRAMDVLDWLRTESHRRGTEEEEVDAEITVWEKPTGARRDVPSASGALHGLAIGPMMVPLQAAQYVNPKSYEESVEDSDAGAGDYVVSKLVSHLESRQLSGFVDRLVDSLTLSAEARRAMHSRSALRREDIPSELPRPRGRTSSSAGARGHE